MIIFMLGLKNRRLYYLLVGDSQVFDVNIMFLKVVMRKSGTLKWIRD